MLACVDTYYFDDRSRTALLIFESWTDSEPTKELIDERVGSAAPYVPGEFFRRELPCIVSIVEPFISRIESIVVDSHVWLDRNHRKGLGALLYDSLNSSINVIGVAKNRFREECGIEVFRGKSKKALIVTAAGLSDTEAATIVKTMHGRYRLPTLLKRADFLSRNGPTA